MVDVPAIDEAVTVDVQRDIERATGVKVTDRCVVERCGYRRRESSSPIVPVIAVAAIVQGNRDIARDQAIDDALRNAVEQATGSLVENETLVENYQLLLKFFSSLL